MEMYGISVYFFICSNPVFPQGYKDALRATALLPLSTHLHVGSVVGRSVGWLVAQSGKLIGGGGSGEKREPSRDHLILRCMLCLRDRRISRILLFPGSGTRINATNNYFLLQTKLKNRSW